MDKEHRSGSWLMTLCFGTACALLVVAGLVGPVQSAAADLPPRPTPVTPTSTPAPKPRKPAGAWIELQVRLPAGDPSLTGQPLWTRVQWQDLNGRWHDVEGWRGTPDRMVNGEGMKVWWVAEQDFGTGPFRWVVQRGQDGEYLAESDPFHLPQAAGTTLTAEVLPTP